MVEDSLQKNSKFAKLREIRWKYCKFAVDEQMLHRAFSSISECTRFASSLIVKVFHWNQLVF